MRGILLTGLAAATFFASGTLGKVVDAMPLAKPSAIGALVQQAHAVCGSSGCVQVHVSGPRKPRTHP
jgi:threonine aldolase